MSMKTRVAIGCVAFFGASIPLLILFFPRPPNYLAVINQQQSAGVTPEENFWVAALKVIPLKDQTPENVARLATFPGFEDAGKPTVCFEDFPSFLSKEDRSIKALSEPWTPDELPEVDDWVNRNKGALDWLTQAANLPKAFFPAIQKSEETFMCDVLLPPFDVQRGIARCYVARANRALASGDVEGAWNDLITILKIARHIEKSSQFIILDLVAISVKAIAVQPLVNCVAHSEWSPAETQNRWQQIAPMLEPQLVFLSFEQCERVGKEAIARELTRESLVHAAFAFEFGLRSGGSVPKNSSDLHKMCLSLQPAPKQAGTDPMTAGSLNIVNTEQDLKIYSLGVDRKDSKGEFDDIAVVLPKK